MESEEALTTTIKKLLTASDTFYQQHTSREKWKKGQFSVLPDS